MSSIHEMKKRMRGDSGGDAVSGALKELDLHDSEEEEEKPVPWTLDALGGDYTDEGIISSLVDEEKYTYNTRKSAKSFTELFRLLCKSKEEEYLSAQ